MNEIEYLLMIEDDDADLIVRLKAERCTVTLPDQTNDEPIDRAIPIAEAVAEMQHISNELHKGLRPFETAGGMWT